MELTKTADTANTSPFNALTTMFYEPTRAFLMLETRRSSWLPLVLLFASTISMMLWYYNVVDFAWLQEQMLAEIKSDAEREQAKSFLGKGTLQAMGVGGIVVGVPIVCALSALYLMLAAKVVKKPLSFGAGFSLSLWSSVPGLLLLPLGAMQIMLSDNAQISYSALNPLSVNQLFFQYDMMHPMASLLDTLSVTTVWSIVLMIIGFQTWAKTSRATAATVVLAPTILIFGLWLAFAMSRVA